MIIDKEFLQYLWHSLNGFYKPEFDKISPEEILQLYIKRKSFLITSKKPIKEKNKTLLVKHEQLLNFVKNNPNLVIGFFKDKKNCRNYRVDQ